MSGSEGVAHAPEGRGFLHQDVGSVDVAAKGVDRLHKGALGLPSIMFLSLAGVAPLIGAFGNIPLGIGLGNGTGMVGGYILVVIVLLLFAVGYAAMSRRLTAAGGFYSFISHGIGRPAGLASGWSGLMGYLMIEVALIGAVGYFGASAFSSLFSINLSWLYYAFIAIALLGVLTYFDVKITAWVLGVAFLIEVFALLVLSITILVKGGPNGTPFSPLSPGDAFKGATPGIGIFFAFWSFIGVEVIPNYAEESKDPPRYGTLGLYGAIIFAGILYLLVSWAGVVGYGLHDSVKVATNDAGNFYFSLSTTYVGKWLTDIVKIFIVTSSFSCALVYHQTTSRYFYALGRERVLPPALGRTHRVWKSPYVATILQTFLVTGAVGTFIGFWYISKQAQHFSGTFANAPFYELFGWLAIAATFWVLLNEVLSSVATIMYFRALGDRQPWWAWRTLVAPALGGAAMAYAIYLLWSNLTTVGGDVIFVRLIPWVCMAWFLVGLAWALWLRSGRPAVYGELGRFVDRSLAIAGGEEFVPVESASGATGMQ